jgi:hypothetical protein
VPPKRERILTPRELNRALLARQLLLERRRMSIPKALERIAGIQAQYAPAMYIGLWSRLEALERDAVTRALERRSVVQGTMMRATIHLVSKADYWPFTAAIRTPRRAWWERVHPNDDPRTMRAAAKKLRRFLADGPRRRKEVEEHLGRQVALGIGTYVDLVRVPPSGTWEQRRADLYGLAEEWVGPDDADPDEGLELLVRRYLGGFGPAYRKDIADFAMMPADRIAAALERLNLRRFRDQDGKELVDLPRAPLLVHARRTHILPEDYRPLVFNTKTPHSVNAFLVDGQVAGSWRYEKGKVELDRFAPVPRTARRDLQDEAKRLAAFFA